VAVFTPGDRGIFGRLNLPMDASWPKFSPNDLVTSRAF